MYSENYWLTFQILLELEPNQFAPQMKATSAPTTTPILQAPVDSEKETSATTNPILQAPDG